MTFKASDCGMCGNTGRTKRLVAPETKPRTLFTTHNSEIPNEMGSEMVMEEFCSCHYGSELKAETEMLASADYVNSFKNLSNQQILAKIDQTVKLEKEREEAVRSEFEL